ncbi:MAG: cytochrome c family protein [Alphaproteobacteria bacterium]|nr:cytochrome c family protein [Alphaproteobacteria bacterium]
MSNFETNKIFAAVLTAGIVAMFAGFVAERLVHPQMPDEDAVPIAALEGSAGGAAPAAADTLEPIMHLIATADIARGEKLSKACAACHSFDQGGPNKVGPNLWGVLGGKKAHLDGFAYSPAMVKAGGTWGYGELNHFLRKPKSFVDGTKMNFAGMKKPEDRAAIIAWLRTMGSSLALPSDSDIAKEAAELAPPPVASEETEAATDAPAGDAKTPPAEAPAE